MPSLDDIEELRGALERGLASGVNDQLTVLTRQNSVQFQNARPRVELVVTIGQATGYKRFFAELGFSKFARWNFTVKFTVITAPAAALARNEGESDADFKARVNANNNLHAIMVADIRRFASSAAQGSWIDVANFPDHYIAESMRDVGSSSTLTPQQAIEKTELTFSGQVGVREASWANAA